MQNLLVSHTYTYAMSEQRVIKVVTGEAAIHYHYDGEGGLIPSPALTALRSWKP